LSLNQLNYKKNQNKNIKNKNKIPLSSMHNLQFEDHEIEWQKHSLHGEVLSPKTITTEEIILKSQK